MNPEIESELKEIKKLVLENRKILEGLQKRARYATLFSTLKWVIYILLIIGAYSILTPILMQFIDTYQSIQEGASTINELNANINGFDINSLKELFN